jgi:MerR family transcriptional regulator, light-induced transcriptional regulator
MNARPAEAFLNAILAGDRARAVVTARDALRQHGLAFVYEEVVQPAMHRIGELWDENRITVADEHLATATAEAAVVLLYPEIRWPVGGPRAIVTCAEQERHQFGARMVADLLTADGWDAMLLGADTPVDAVVSMTKRAVPVFVGISITLAPHLRGARRLVRSLRAATPGVKIIVGGRALSLLPVPSIQGMDVFAASGSDAVEVVRAWKS